MLGISRCVVGEMWLSTNHRDNISSIVIIVKEATFSTSIRKYYLAFNATYAVYINCLCIILLQLLYQIESIDKFTTINSIINEHLFN